MKVHHQRERSVAMVEHNSSTSARTFVERYKDLTFATPRVSFHPNWNHTFQSSQRCVISRNGVRHHHPTYNRYLPHNLPNHHSTQPVDGMATSKEEEKIRMSSLFLSKKRWKRFSFCAFPSRLVLTHAGPLNYQDLDQTMTNRCTWFPVGNRERSACLSHTKEDQQGG